MKSVALFLSFLAAAAQAQQAPLDLLRDMETIPFQQRAVAVDQFLDDHPLNPVAQTGSDTLVLLYRGPCRDVRLAGDHTAWNDGIAFRHIPGTDLWYLADAYPSKARLDYKIVVDGTWRLDPRNPLTCVGGFGPNSELQGRDYRAPAWLAEESTIPCRLDTFEVVSPQLGDTRTVVVAVPGGATDTPRPLLIVHDGLEYLTLGGLRHYLDVAGGGPFGSKLPICVCIPPVQRTAEYAESRQEAFGRFVVETVMPLIEVRYADIGEVGAPWGSMGASYGGRITLDLARRYPDRFDRLAPMSPAIAPEQHDGIAARDPAGLRIYLNWGRYDIPGLIPACERFDTMLTERGFPHRTEVLPQGHSWGLWRDTLAQAFHTLYIP